MKFQSKLLKGQFKRRYKRFFVEAQLENGLTTAHCPNTGSMKGLLEEGNIVWFSKTSNPKRKLKYTWELVLDKKSNSLVGINTHSPNKIVYEALLKNKIENLVGYDIIKREVKYGNNSRIDFLLEREGMKSCYLEVKNVHYTDGRGIAKFPDAVTSRGLKHLNELIEVVNRGNRAVMLYLVQREDCDKFLLAKDIDPEYCKGFNEAVINGVEILCFSCKISLSSILIGDKITILDQKN